MRSPLRSWRRILRWTAFVALLVGAFVVVDVALLLQRIDRVPVDVPDHDDDATTWLLIATDALSTPETEPDAEPGADIVILVRTTALDVTAVTISRDLAVIPGLGARSLASVLEDGVQPVVDGVCDQLGVALDHVAVIDMARLAGSVDAVGGVEVEVPTPMRDAATGLGEVGPGLEQLDGRTALAFVRSRQPEILVEGEWLPAEPDEAWRAERGAQVLFALGNEASPSIARPLQAQRVAWNLADSLVVSSTAGAQDLLDLTGSLSWFQQYAEGITDLPVKDRGGAVPLAVLTREGVDLLGGLRSEDPLRPSPCPAPVVP